MMTMEPLPGVKETPKIFSGRYTVESTQTGEHRTFWIRRQDDNADFCPGMRIVYLLTGTENDNPDHYTGFGYVYQDRISVWSSKRVPGKKFEQYADMLWTLALDGAFSRWADKGYKIHLEAACARCGRPLTTPESVKAGIGPICRDLGF